MKVITTLVNSSAPSEESPLEPFRMENDMVFKYEARIPTDDRGGGGSQP